MLILIRFFFLLAFLLSVSGCSDGAIGMRGSPAWYLTAPQEAIAEYEKNGGRRSYGSASNYSYGSTNSSSRISASGRTIYNSDGSSSRISTSGRNIYHSDGSSSRISSSGRNIYNSDGSSCRISASGRNMYCN